MSTAEKLVPAPAEVPNLIALLDHTTARRGHATAAKSKLSGTWQDISWLTFQARARAISDGLAAIGVQPGERIALLADTSYDWVSADFGIMGAGAIVVPIYQSNKPHEIQYILENSGATYVILDSDAQAEKLRLIRKNVPALKSVIRTRGSIREGERLLEEIEQLGAAWRRSHEQAHAARVGALHIDDVACILYTSGTTGNPKGVMLTHGNWVYEAQAVSEINIINDSDRILLFLPLAHSFAKVIETAWIGVGAEMAFAESTDKLVDNAGEVQPTVMPAVPRIFEKAYANVIAKGSAAGGLKGKLFKSAMAAFEGYAAERERGADFQSFRFSIGKHLVFPKLAATLKERFGGRMRLFVSGGAPLSPKIAYFFDLLGIEVLEGFGLTETSAATCVNRPGQNKIGTVGPAVPGTEIHIAEDGEVLLKGAGIMKGYYNQPEATAEVLQDGWFATGDIGQLDVDGCLKITDRKKDIIVTAGGKNVAPQNLENALKTDPILSQVVVHGDRRKFLSALITLNEEAALRWAKENGVNAKSLAELASHPKMQERVQRAVDALNATQASYSTIKKFAILPNDFTLESGELTPSLKIKRKYLAQKYKQIVDSFYAD